MKMPTHKSLHLCLLLDILQFFFFTKTLSEFASSICVLELLLPSAACSVRAVISQTGVPVTGRVCLSTPHSFCLSFIKREENEPRKCKIPSLSQKSQQRRVC